MRLTTLQKLRVVIPIHWDLVLIQRAEYGGGEIWFDDVLIRKDGKFILPELEPLNFC